MLDFILNLEYYINNQFTFKGEDKCQKKSLQSSV